MYAYVPKQSIRRADMINSDRVKEILFGGDYNPEQWPEEVWEEDMRLFQKAHVNVVTLNVFSWASLQPEEDRYDFERLDRIMELAKENQLKVCLATSTAVHPAWMARKYPDVLRVENTGMKRKYGARANSCPNSPTFIKYSAKLAGQLAKRYGDYENLVAWHINNEYGGFCYCENCEKAFRKWLKERYTTLENLNKAWNTSFWGHNMWDWEDIVVPDFRSEEFMWNGIQKTNFQGISLDYMRFNSDSLLMNYQKEVEAIREFSKEIPVTTNLMGFNKQLDYQKWAKYMDFVSWDNYPEHDAIPAVPAMAHDLNRGLKKGQAFCLMEQTPSVSNWLSYCRLKRPGVMRMLSYQALAHGSDTVMFFQMRRSVGACEKYHGALIDHVGNEKTRVFREMEALGDELAKMRGAFLGATTQSKVAVLFDWENWWAAELSAGPTRLMNYYEEVLCYYRAFSENNIAVDFIGVEDELRDYSLVIAPMLYLVKKDYDEKLRAFVKEGGNLVMSYFSGYVDENDIVTTGGYPGKLRDILGIWVEESDAIPENESNSFEYNKKIYPATVLCDLLHANEAKVLATYKQDFYASMPALTVNQYGKGKAYYVATRSDERFYENFLMSLCKGLKIKPCQEAPKDVEATLRSNKRGEFLFLLNHSDKEQEVKLSMGGLDLVSGKKCKEGKKLILKPLDVAIIMCEKKKK